MSLKATLALDRAMRGRMIINPDSLLGTDITPAMMRGYAKNLETADGDYEATDAFLNALLYRLHMGELAPTKWESDWPVAANYTRFKGTALSLFDNLLTTAPPVVTPKPTDNGFQASVQLIAGEHLIASVARFRSYALCGLYCRAVAYLHTYAHGTPQGTAY